MEPVGCLGPLLCDFSATLAHRVLPSETRCQPQEGDKRARSDPSRPNLGEKVNFEVILCRCSVRSILTSVWKSMATVAHIGKRFRFHFQHDRPIDSGFGLKFDGHGGAHREAIWVPLPTVAHIGGRFGIEFRHGLEIGGHGGAHWEAISVRFPTRSSDRFWFRSGCRWLRWSTSGSDLDSIFAFISHAMWESGLDRPESPGAMVAHIGRASLFVPRSPTSQPPTIHEPSRAEPSRAEPSRAECEILARFAGRF